MHTEPGSLKILSNGIPLVDIVVFAISKQVFKTFVIAILSTLLWFLNIPLYVFRILKREGYNRGHREHNSWLHKYWRNR